MARDGQPIEAGLVQRVAMGMRYALTGRQPHGWFGPGEPMAPQAPDSVTGRQFDFPTAYNLQTRPRPAEPIGFAELRAIADAYDLLRLVIETRKDQMEKLRWRFVRCDGDERDAADPRLAVLTDFFGQPDREHGWAAWLRMVLEDLLVLDAPALYARCDAAGRLYALEPLDGATIKRVLDERGRTPLPPDPAYQQVLKGVPATDFTCEELIYQPRNLRTNRVYGYGPVEQVLASVNIALRRQVSQLHYYTEGNVPEALIGVPASWSADQIRQFQDYWDALLEGNSAFRRHAKFVPGELKYQPVREPMLKDEYDEWLARIVCFAFSISPAPFIRDMNRATAETAQEAALQEGLAPLMNWVKQLIDGIVRRYWGWTDIEFAWSDDKVQKPLERAQIDQIYVAAGIKTADEVRHELGLAPLPRQTDPMGKANPDVDQQARNRLGRFALQDDAAGPGAALADDDPPGDPAMEAAIRRLNGATEKEAFVYGQIAHAEGGRDRGSSAMNGLLQARVDGAATAGIAGIAPGTKPSDLTIDQRAAVYRYLIGKQEERKGFLLADIDSKYSTAALADCIFTRPGRLQPIMDANAAVWNSLSAAEQQAMKSHGVNVGDDSHSSIISAYKGLSNSGHGEALRKELAEQRRRDFDRRLTDPKISQTEADRLRRTQRGNEARFRAFVFPGRP